MSDRHTPSPLPRAGDAAYFVHLHVNTAEYEQKHEHLKKTDIYRINGKSRPMLVISALPVDRGQRWFLTLPITSKPTDSKDRDCADIEPIGSCLDEDRSSFVKLEIHKMPENLLHPLHGKSPVIAPCDPMAFRNAVQVIEHKALGGKLPRVL